MHVQQHGLRTVSSHPILALLALLALALLGCGDDPRGGRGGDYFVIDDEEEEEDDEPGSAVCGNSACESGETAASCAQDCPARCGDRLCTHNETAWTCPGDCPPQYVTIRFQQALVGPVKADGCQWDGFTCSPLSGEALDGFSKIASGNPIATIVLDLFRQGIFDSLNKPDPRGRISRAASGTSVDIPETADNFLVTFGATFTRVRYEPSMVFDVFLEDVDVTNHDPIWNGTLRFAQFEQALLAKQDFWIDLRSGSQNQLIGIQVSVTPE